MRRELFVHFTFMVSFFIFIFLFRRWFDFYHLPFWFGGVVGTLLPDLDHILYIYFLNPTDLTSQRALSLMRSREVARTLDLLAETRYERTRLIFHTATFQIIFLVLTFLVVTSSGSPFGKGLVLAFSLHLLIDELVDFMQVGDISGWFKDFPINLSLDKQKMLFYWLGNLILLLLFGFIF